MKKIFLSLLFLFPFIVAGQGTEIIKNNTEDLTFTERFILDKIVELRVDLETVHRELNEKIITREYDTVNKALSYSSNTISYFFYFITLAVGVLALFGWRSIKEIKDSAHRLVEKESDKIVKDLRRRIEKTEQDLEEKRASILKSQQEFEARQKINTLWGIASREKDDRKKLDILDEIERLSPTDAEVFVKKSGSYLRLGLLEAALKATNTALVMDPSHSIALYNRACSHARLGEVETALADLKESIQLNPSLKMSAETDKDFSTIRDQKKFQELLK